MNGINTGYNESEVTQTIEKMINSYNELYDVLSIEMQKNFVDVLASKWASHYAVEFFNTKFKPSLDTLLDNVNSIFDSVVRTIINAAMSWAQTSGTIFSHNGLNLKSLKIDVSSIKENIDGIRGFNTDMDSTVSYLQTISNKTDEILVSVILAVQESGFIGGDMQDSLMSNFTIIKNKLSSDISDLINLIKDYINNTVTEYNRVAAQTKDSFAQTADNTSKANIFKTNEVNIASSNHPKNISKITISGFKNNNYSLKESNLNLGGAGIRRSVKPIPTGVNSFADKNLVKRAFNKTNAGIISNTEITKKEG